MSLPPSAALTPANLALADLEAAGPAVGSGREQRFLCPFCGAGKKPDASHKSLSANRETGLWHCHRCGSKGLLQEFRTAPVPHQAASPRSRHRATLHRVTALPLLSPPPTAEAWERTLVIGSKRFQVFEFSAEGYTDVQARSYLSHRGIPYETAHAAGVRFCPDWLGRPAIMFPLYDGAGNLIAAQGRYMDGREDPKTRSVGAIGGGVFAAPGAWDAPAVILTEAPLDALSLSACGLPALALCGKDVRPWLLPKLAFRSILLALDADAAGDAAAAAWDAELRRFGAAVSRLRPEGGKDWNEVLMTQGRRVLADRLARTWPVSAPVFEEPLSFFDQVCQIFSPVTILDP